MKLKTSYGIVKYQGGKCSLYIDQSFQDYYFTLIPKYYYAMKPKYPPHITIVRSGIETIKQNYGMWDGMKVPFLYEPLIRQDQTYFWIDTWSWHIALLRLKLGLGIFREGFSCYHITIANKKVKNHEYV